MKDLSKLPVRGVEAVKGPVVNYKSKEAAKIAGDIENIQKKTGFKVGEFFKSIWRKIWSRGAKPVGDVADLKTEIARFEGKKSLIVPAVNDESFDAFADTDPHINFLDEPPAPEIRREISDSYKVIKKSFTPNENISGPGEAGREKSFDNVAGEDETSPLNSDFYDLLEEIEGASERLNFVYEKIVDDLNSPLPLSQNLTQRYFRNLSEELALNASISLNFEIGARGEVKFVLAHPGFLDGRVEGAVHVSRNLDDKYSELGLIVDGDDSLSINSGNFDRIFKALKSDGYEVVKEESDAMPGESFLWVYSPMTGFSFKLNYTNNALVEYFCAGQDFWRTVREKDGRKIICLPVSKKPSAFAKLRHLNGLGFNLNLQKDEAGSRIVASGRSLHLEFQFLNTDLFGKKGLHFNAGNLYLDDIADLDDVYLSLRKSGFEIGAYNEDDGGGFYEITDRKNGVKGRLHLSSRLLFAVNQKRNAEVKQKVVDVLRRVRYQQREVFEFAPSGEVYLKEDVDPDQLRFLIRKMIFAYAESLKGQKMDRLQGRNWSYYTWDSFAKSLFVGENFDGVVLKFDLDFHGVVESFGVHVNAKKR